MSLVTCPSSCGKLMEMEVPATQYSESSNGAIFHQDDTQGSVKRVPESEDTDEVNVIPESPPVYTQDTDDDEVEGEEVPKTNKEIGDAGESSKNADASVAGGRSRKCSDVIIDIEDDDSFAGVAASNGPSTSTGVNKSDFEIEEFPEDDDKFLLSAAEKAEREGLDTVQDTGEAIPEEQTIFTPVTEDMRVNAELMAEEKQRKKEVESFRKFKPLDKIFPDVRCSEHNTVAFHMERNYMPGDPLEPHPPTCTPKWDTRCIPMPFCDENVIILRQRQSVPNDADNTQNPAPARKAKLWHQIKQAFSGFPILSVDDIENCISYYCNLNSKLTALSYCIERLMNEDERTTFFTKAIPMMTSLILNTPEIITCPLPFLRKNTNYNISLSQKQVACLLANAFFCTFPRRFKSEMDMPSINFKALFIEEDDRALKPKAHKIRCIINYFIRIQEEMPQGIVTYTRKFFRYNSMPDWEKLDKGLTKLIPLLEGTIEDDGEGMLKVDFANSVIGGGVLNRGAVQEEILFVIYPELIVSRLFTEKLNNNEAVIITGCERFSKYKGYSVNFQFDGDYQDTSPYDSKGRRCTQIVAIDALYITRPTFQYNPKHFAREINKAFVGFSSPTPQSVAIASGKWGCGAFNGDPHLKAIIQLLAASNAGRDVVFFTFGDITCLNDVISIYDSIRDMKIKEVWNLLHQYHSLCCTSNKASQSLKDFCAKYAAGRLMEVEREERSRASSAQATKKTKDVPITYFYSYEKRRLPAALDDETVADITTGINKINAPTKNKTPSSQGSSGKRQREGDDDEGDKKLTEAEIQIELLKDEYLESTSTGESVREKSSSGNSKADDKVTSPSKSSKRPKTNLIDFFADPSEPKDT